MKGAFFYAKKVNSDVIKLYETSQVKLKIAGNTQEVQFMAGNNNQYPIKNISKEKYIDKQTGEIKERKKSVDRYQTVKSINYYNDHEKEIKIATQYCKDVLKKYTKKNYKNIKMNWKRNRKAQKS